MAGFFPLTLTETFGKSNVLFLHTAGWLEGEELMVCGSLYPAVLFWQGLGWCSVTAVLIISRAPQFRFILGCFPVSWKQRHCQECQAFAAGSTTDQSLASNSAFPALMCETKHWGHLIDFLVITKIKGLLLFVCLIFFASDFFILPPGLGYLLKELHAEMLNSRENSVIQHHSPLGNSWMHCHYRNLSTSLSVFLGEKI